MRVSEEAAIVKLESPSEDAEEGVVLACEGAAGVRQRAPPARAGTRCSERGGGDGRSGAGRGGRTGARWPEVDEVAGVGRGGQKWTRWPEWGLPRVCPLAARQMRFLCVEKVDCGFFVL
jgi:hypothetical protein